MYNPKMAPFQPENIDRTTSMLMELKQKGQLAQYMQQHMANPYLMALASSVNNMFNKAQMPQGGEQPKVVDQALAQMAAPQGAAQAMPEDTGIGALPAGDMNFADGGIVGFAGDGPSLVQSDYLNVPGMVTGDLYAKAMVKARASGRAQPTQQDFAEVAAMGDPTGSGFAEIANVPTTGRGTLFQRFTGEPEWKMDRAAAQATKTAATDPAFRRAASPGALPSMPSAAEQMAALKPPVAGAGAGAGAGINLLQTTPRAPVTTGIAQGAPTSVEEYMRMLRKADEAAGASEDPLEARKREATAKAVKGEEEALGRYKTETAEEEKHLSKGKEERLNKREAELGKETRGVEGRALVLAGLTMLKKGVAQGANVGFQAYTAGIDKIQSAKEKLDEARDRMEELRQNRASMNRTEVRNAEKGIRQLVNQSENSIIEGAAQATGERKKDVRAGLAVAFGAAEAEKDRASRIEASRIAAGPGMARVEMARAAQQDESKARTEFGKLQTKVMSELSKDANYMMAPEAQKATIATARLRQELMNNPFLAQYATGIGFGKAPATNTVRTLDEE